MAAFARFADPGRQPNVGGDVLADAAVARVLEGPGPTPANLVDAVRALAADGDPACAAFVRHVVSIPEWVDPELVELGCRVTLSLSVPIGAVLAVGSLPEVYAVPAIAKALGATGRLKNLTWLRILETGRFLRDVHGDDAGQPLGVAGQAIAQVRLVHALVRHKIVSRGGPTCITQQQLAFVLCTHSHVIRRGLDAMGLPMTDREARAHQHLWRLIGHRMGIETDGLAASRQEEARLYARLWLRMVDGTDPACRELTRIGLDTAARKARVPMGLTRAIARRLLRPTLAARLQIGEPCAWDRALQLGVPILRRLYGLRSAIPGASAALLWLGRSIADAVVAGDPSPEPVGVAAARGALNQERRR